ncbi:unnamed protein product [Bemisia tabaci]|uniref:ER-bound oxygenase mpaB/mpaB'/Rubber oxygenase catalytic domain-containing protein n=2 Tax=Bemisia tabaci TaxID=7038 RepID=A0A9P0C2L7_BEMTA|nr:unnamed protein product [Bemisia tabaci]
MVEAEAGGAENLTEVKVRDAEMGRERAERILNEGANIPVNLKQTGRLPPWYDPQKFKKGQEFFHQNYFALFVSKLAGLIVVLAIASILRVLKMSRKSGDKITAYKRYMATIHHMLMWYDGDLEDPQSRAHKSLIMVRGFHCAASNKANGVGFGHISQKDMALTQFGFMGFSLLNFKLLGLKGTSDQIDGFVHFWRTIGYLMGINDKFNLCDGNPDETEEACRIVLERAFVPGLARDDPDFIHFSTALMEGMRPVVPIWTPAPSWPSLDISAA